MATPTVHAGRPVPGRSVGSGESGPAGIATRPRRVRRRTVIAVVVVVLSVVFAAFYLETRAGGPTGVVANGAELRFNYTNAPVGQTFTNVFYYGMAWFNGGNESPSATSIQAPAGSVVRLLLEIVDDRFPPGVPVNCSVNGIAALPPFAIVSLEGQFKTGLWNPQPFPLNFSGESQLSDPSALLALNVTLPSQNGVYTPAFVLDITCEQYG